MESFVKNLSIFTALYALSLIVSNLIAIFLLFLGLRFLPLIMGGYYSYLLLPFPTIGIYTAALPPEMLAGFELKYNPLGILLSILTFITAFYLVFKRRVKLKYWLVALTIFNLLVIIFFTNFQSFRPF